MISVVGARKTNPPPTLGQYKDDLLLQQHGSVSDDAIIDKPVASTGGWFEEPTDEGDDGSLRVGQETSVGKGTPQKQGFKASSLKIMAAGLLNPRKRLFIPRIKDICRTSQIILKRT